MLPLAVFGVWALPLAVCEGTGRTPGDGTAPTPRRLALPALPTACARRRRGKSVDPRARCQGVPSAVRV